MVMVTVMDDFINSHHFVLATMVVMSVKAIDIAMMNGYVDEDEEEEEGECWNLC